MWYRETSKKNHEENVRFDVNAYESSFFRAVKPGNLSLAREETGVGVSVLYSSFGRSYTNFYFYYFLSVLFCSTFRHLTDQRQTNKSHRRALQMEIAQGFYFDVHHLHIRSYDNLHF